MVFNPSKIPSKKKEVKNYRSKLSGIGPLVDADASETDTVTVVGRTGEKQVRLQEAKFSAKNRAQPVRFSTGSRNQPRNTGLAEKENEAVVEPIVSTQEFQIEAKDISDLRIPDNPLLPFVNLQYHLALSMVPEASVSKIQKRIPGATPAESGTFNELQRSIDTEGSIPFASTGDTFQSDISRVLLSVDEVSGGSNTRLALVGGKNYYNIESLNLSNVMAPTPQNPYITSMLTGKITLVEPHGFKWAEDARRIANKLGYSGLSMGRIMWRLDVFFSGYNQDTGEWLPFIQMDARTRKTKVLTYYLNITTVDASLTHTGTTYDMSIVPNGHSAYRPEEVVVDAGAIFTGSQSQTQTFGGFLERISQSMNKAVSDRTNGQVKRIYEFKAPPELLAAEFFSGDFEDKHGFLKNDPKSGSAVTPARDVNVLSLLEDALKDLPKVWKRLLKKDDPKHLKPRVHWGIRFNVVYGNGANFGTNDYDTITNQYIIEPFVTFKSTRMNNRTEMAKVVDAKSQSDRIVEMIRLGMVNRIYNYVNTSENNEVIELDLKLKNFYYHTMFNPAESSASAGIMQAEASGSQANHRAEISLEVDEEGTNSEDNGEVVPSNQESTTSSSLRRLFGRVVDNPSAVCDAETFKTPFDIYGGGFGEMPKTDYRGSVGSSDQLERAEYEANVNEHIRNDLIKIEMQVRGDPLWLLTPYGNDSGNVLASPDQTNNVQGTTALVQTQSSRVFFLRMFAPSQDNYMNPDRDAASTSCAVVGGFYEVIKVDSTFEGGKFVQNLLAAKMNHLNYAENFISIVSNDNADTGEPVDSNVPKTNSQPNISLPVNIT